MAGRTEYQGMKQETKKAAAVRYNPLKEKAPRLLAKGAGFVAERILDLAKRYDIPVREDSELVNALSKLEINTQIPAELYEAVAQVLAFLYSANKDLASKGHADQADSDFVSAKKFT